MATKYRNVQKILTNFCFLVNPKKKTQEELIFLDILPSNLRGIRYKVTKLCLQVRCLQSEYHCERSDLCVKEKELCDGTRQCPRGDDERSCKKYLSAFEKSKSSTLIIRNLIQTLYREEVGVCAKRCLDDMRCKGIIYDEQKRE